MYRAETAPEAIASDACGCRIPEDETIIDTPRHRTPIRPTRRALLRSGLLLGAGGITTAFTGCTAPDGSTLMSEPDAASASPTVSPGGGETAVTGRVLLAYFSRAGENYHYGGRRNLEVGNTKVLADMIAGLIDCDVHEIVAEDPYPAGYDATVARNVDEQDADARPTIAEPLSSIDGYAHVLLGSPIWNVRPPMIMSTFADSYDFAGTTVHPFVTYAVSGQGSTERIYTEACPGARIAPGLAVQGEEVTQHRDDVATWLRRAGLLAA